MMKKYNSELKSDWTSAFKFTCPIWYYPPIINDKSEMSPT